MICCGLSVCLLTHWCSLLNSSIFLWFCNWILTSRILEKKFESDSLGIIWDTPLGYHIYFLGFVLGSFVMNRIFRLKVYLFLINNKSYWEKNAPSTDLYITIYAWCNVQSITLIMRYKYNFLWADELCSSLDSFLELRV